MYLKHIKYTGEKVPGLYANDVKKPYVTLVSTILVIILCFFILFSTVNASSEKNEVTVIYFYWSVCPACNEAEKALNEIYDMKKSTGNTIEMDIRMYNIDKEYHYRLFQKYLDEYNVPEEKQNAPIAFIGDAFYYGKADIINGLKTQLEIGLIKGTPILSLSDKDSKSVEKHFSTLKASNVFLSGLVGGLNPCSLSMLLFLFSLLVVKRVSIKQMGFAFGAGKFISYLLLGTVLFNLLSRLNEGLTDIIGKVVMMIFIVIVAVLNIKDFFAARNEEYDKIRNQLPATLRKMNHKWIKKFTDTNNSHLLVLMSFVLGISISVGEFLCTGQMYIATIAYILQSNTPSSVRAFIYLLIYITAFLLPLVVLTLLIDKGKEIFDVSEVIRAKLPAIKLVTGIAFLVLGGIMVFIF